MSRKQHFKHTNFLISDPPSVTVQPPIFTTHYTKISILLFAIIHINYIVRITSSPPLDFPQNKTLPSSFFPPSFRYASVPTISNPIYSNNIYLTLSQISRTALSVRSHPPPKPPIIFKFFAMLPPSAEKI